MSSRRSIISTLAFTALVAAPGTNESVAPASSARHGSALAGFLLGAVALATIGVPTVRRVRQREDLTGDGA